MRPVLFKIFNDCVYNALPEITVLMPDYTKHEVKRLKKLFTHEDSLAGKTSLIEALSVMKAWAYKYLKKNIRDEVPTFFCGSGSGSAGKKARTDQKSK